MRMRFHILLLVLGMTLAVSWVALAQGDCPALVEQALTAVGDNCAGLDRNTACYGYNLVTATFTQAQPVGFFGAPAERADLKVLQTVRTAPLDLADQIWGVAVMNVQANVPNSLPGQAVTFILMGDAELTNAVPPDQALEPVEPVDVTVVSAAELRSAPGADGSVVASLPAGTSLPADALSQDAQWVRVLFENQVGWVNRDALDPAARVSGLPVVTPETRSPMQAFYFTSGVGRPACTEAPSTLAVRSPENIQVDLTVNGANIQMGSFVTWQVCGENRLCMTVHDGEVVDDDGNVTGAGQTTEFILDEDGSIVGRGETRPATEDELEAGQTAMQFVEAVGEEEGEPEATETPEATEIPDVCATTEYVVQPGDNLFRIALRFDTSMSSIVAANNIVNPSLIRVGQRLSIPNPCSGFQGLPGGGGQQGTGQPAGPSGIVQGVECSGFVPTSPPNGGPIPFGGFTFYWNPAPGATNYRLNVYNPDGALWFTRTTQGPETSIAVNSAEFGGGDSFLWDVEALKDGVSVCRTIRQLLTRGPDPNIPTVTPTLPFTASWRCDGLYQFSVTVSGVADGEQVRITYSSSFGSPSPSSGTVFTVPPRTRTFSDFGPIFVSNGKVTRLSTGEVISLPGTRNC